MMINHILMTTNQTKTNSLNNNVSNIEAPDSFALTNVQPIFLTDLDDTLFQTARKMPPQNGNTPRYLAATKQSGAPISFQSEIQNNFTQWLLAHSEVIPITARSSESFSRVKLPFKNYAVCTNGGVILRPDGTVDSNWQTQMHEDLAPFDSMIRAFDAELKNLAQSRNIDIRTFTIIEHKTAMYYNVKHNQNNIAELQSLMRDFTAEVDLADFYTHSNDNNFAIIPNVLGKRRAALEIIKRMQSSDEKRPVIGMGDSISDLGFMSVCDWWVTPKKSQIEQALATYLP